MFEVVGYLFRVLEQTSGQDDVVGAERSRLHLIVRPESEQNNKLKLFVIFSSEMICGCAFLQSTKTSVWQNRKQILSSL